MSTMLGSYLQGKSKFVCLIKATMKAKGEVEV
jgi:hypothetical protein